MRALTEDRREWWVVHVHHARVVLHIDYPILHNIYTTLQYITLNYILSTLNYLKSLQTETCVLQNNIKSKHKSVWYYQVDWKREDDAVYHS